MSTKHFLTTALLPVTLLALFANGFVIKLETRNLPDRNTVFLYCRDEVTDVNIPTSNIGLNRTVLIDGSIQEMAATGFTVLEDGKLRLTITPATEGNYTCIDQSTSTVSSNHIALVASPVLDPDFVVGGSQDTELGSNATLPCSLISGALASYYYTTAWYRGTSQVTASSKYIINPDLSLTINTVNQLDTSQSYYCRLTVSDPVMQVDYVQYGLDTGLRIYGGLDLYPNVLSDTVVRQNASSVVFSCTIESIPVGNISWLINGTLISESDTRISIDTEIVEVANFTSVTSNLTISSPLLPSDSGTVQCIGYSENGLNTLLVSEDASLTVLGDTMDAVFEVTPTGSLILTLSLPGVIPLVFTVHLRLTSNGNVFDLILSDPSFYNTASINMFEIARESLPASITSSFTASVAIEVLGTIGPFTNPSLELILPVLSSGASQYTATTSSTTHHITSSITATPTTTQHYSSPSVGVASLAVRPSCVQMACPACLSPFPYLMGVIVLGILLVLVLSILVAMCVYCVLRSPRKVRNTSEHAVNNGTCTCMAYQHKDHVELHVRNPYSASTSPTQTSTSCSRDSHTHSPCSAGDDSHSYSSIDEHSKSRTYTPSRPSSQESYFREDRPRGISPSPLPHIYENEESLRRKVNLGGGEPETRHTTSSIAVGTSPPLDGKEIIIPAFIKGQSESPPKRKDGGHYRNGSGTGGMMSPAYSDPSLESSVKSSEYSAKRGLSQTIAIPSSRKDTSEHTYTSPTQALHNPAQPTLQQFLYGENKPPVKAPKEEPKKEDKIYQKLAKEYDIIGTT